MVALGILFSFLVCTCEAASFARVDGISIPGAGNLFGAGGDAVRGFAFFVDDGKGTGGSDCGGCTCSQVYKVDDATFAVVDSLELDVCDAKAMVVDAGQGAGIIYTYENPGVIVLVDLVAMTQLRKRTSSSQKFFAAVIHPGLSQSWGVSETGDIVTIDYAVAGSTLTIAATRVTGDVFATATFDGTYLYIGSNTIPGKVSRFTINPVAITSSPGIVALNEGENYLTCAIFNFEKGTAIFGTDTFPGYIVEIDVATMTRTGSVKVPTAVRSATVGPNGLAYFGAQAIPTADVYMLNITSFELIKSVKTVEERFNSVALVGEHAYFGTQSNPGKVVKVSLSRCPNDCTDGGTCQPDGTCSCDDLRAGPDCSIRLCQDNCNDRGDCVGGVCECYANYTGTLCEERRCFPGCGEDLGHGECNDGVCNCTIEYDQQGLWHGETCDEFGFFCAPNDPFFTCNGHGYCPYSLETTRCVCDDGWRFSAGCETDDSGLTFYQLILREDLPDDEFVELLSCAANVTEDRIFLLTHENPPPTYVFTLRDMVPGDGTGAEAYERLRDAAADEDNICWFELNITSFSGTRTFVSGTGPSFVTGGEAITETQTTVIEGKKDGLIAAIVCSIIAVCCCACLVPFALYQLKLHLVKKALAEKKVQTGHDDAML